MMENKRIIALDGSSKAGKTELAKRIIVLLKAKGYEPVVIESSNSFFNLCDLYNFTQTPIQSNKCNPHITKDHYTGISYFKDCFFHIPINKYLNIYYTRNEKCNIIKDNEQNKLGCSEFILNSLFSLYYQVMSAAETAIALNKKTVVILDGSPFETLVWYSIYAKDHPDASKYALDMIRKINSKFSCIFNQMLYVLTHTEVMQIYDRLKFDDKTSAEYRAIYCQMTNGKTDIDIGTQIQIGIDYTNKFFQSTKDIVRCEQINTLVVPGNYAEEINRNAMNITFNFSPLTTKNDGFPGN